MNALNDLAVEHDAICDRLLTRELLLVSGGPTASWIGEVTPEPERGEYAIELHGLDEATLRRVMRALEGS